MWFPVRIGWTVNARGILGEFLEGSGWLCIADCGRGVRGHEKPLPASAGSGSSGGRQYFEPASTSSCQYFASLFANAGAGAVLSSLGTDTLDGSPSEV